jgi:hypothetical protein
LEDILEEPAYRGVIEKIEHMTNWLRNDNNSEIIKQVSGLKALDYVAQDGLLNSQ